MIVLVYAPGGSGSRFSTKAQGSQGQWRETSVNPHTVAPHASGSLGSQGALNPSPKGISDSAQEQAPDFIQNRHLGTTLATHRISSPSCRKETYTSLSSNFWTCRKLLIISLGDGSSTRVQYRAVSKSVSYGGRAETYPTGRVTPPCLTSRERTTRSHLRGLAGDP